eukprot:m.3681 g.3681  ORF g.3681 m.3681 type:complete len:392 (+) comp2109_c0_seq1:72-1247(+)
MSFPEDPYSRDELFGQCMIEALEEMEKKSVATEDAPAEVVLSPSAKARVAHLVGKSIIGGDLTSLKDCDLGGETLYSTVKVSRAVKGALAEALEDADELGDSSMHQRVSMDIASTKGARRQMEDRHVSLPDLNAITGQSNKEPQSFFAVYDGHGGVEIAQYLQAQLHLNVVEQPEYETDPKTALINGFLQTDTKIVKKANRDAIQSGSTAVVVLMKGRKMYVAWCGDSQTFLCRDGAAVELMNPHKPEREDEKKRIEDSGGIVVWYGAWRVNAVLSVSRAFGDAKLKKYVIPDPDITEHDLDDKCEYVVIACDGLWDVMDKDKVVEFISSWKDSHDGSMVGVAEAIATHSVQDLSSNDNITIVIVSLHDLSSDIWSTPVEGVVDEDVEGSS